MSFTPAGMRPTDTDAADKARRGREALFPFDRDTRFGTTAVGADQVAPLTYPGMETLLIAPPLFTPHRYERLVELGREPLHLDVDTRVRMGRFVAALPIAVAAMGSTDLANRHGIPIAKAAGAAGVVMSIGENVAAMRGYDKRLNPGEPSLKERMLAYLEACPEGEGGLLIQQSVEDADDELWNRIYSDPDLTKYLDAGMLGFEIKAGQGAKPGLGGEVRVTRKEALRLAEKFSFPEDPRTTKHETYDRHAAPGTFTAEILRNMLRLLHNNFPKASIWLKLGGYRDVGAIIQVAQEAGVDAITIDGHAGGTGMAPALALRHLGLPTIHCLGRIAAHRRTGSDMTMIVAGGLGDGADAVKAIAAGASGIALGRALLAAAEADEDNGVARFFATVKEEVQLMASAVGKYHLEDLSSEDIMATDPRTARALGVTDAYGATFDEPSSAPAPPGAATAATQGDATNATNATNATGST